MTLAVALAVTLALAILVAHMVAHDMMGVDFTKSGRVTKPRFGGGGPHFVHADAPSHYRKIEFVSFSSLTFRTFDYVGERHLINLKASYVGERPTG